MARRDFFTDEAREGVRRAVVSVESQTSAELVVAVRRRSASYRAADYLAGAIAAFVVLLLLLFHPYEIPTVSMPLTVLMAFALGAFVCSGWWPLKRALTPRHAMVEAVAHAARAVFVDRGVSRTAGRNGILVLVSMLERRIDVVCDVGIDAAALGASFRDAVEEIRRAVAEESDIASLSAALMKLGPPLASVLPRSADDVNELPDVPVHIGEA